MGAEIDISTRSYLHICSFLAWACATHFCLCNVTVFFVLPEDMMTQYDIHIFEFNNYISFAGFTSAGHTSDCRCQFAGSNSENHRNVIWCRTWPQNGTSEELRAGNTMKKKATKDIEFAGSNSKNHRNAIWCRTWPQNEPRQPSAVGFSASHADSVRCPCLRVQQLLLLCRLLISEPHEKRDVTGKAPAHRWAAFFG